MGIRHTDSFTDNLFRVCPNNQFVSRDIPEKDSYDRVENIYRFYSKKDGSMIASFKARALPGCCGVLVIHHLVPHTKPKTHIKVFADTLDTIITAAGQSRFGLVLLTQVEKSTGYQVLCSERFQIVSFPDFENYKTTNKVGVFGIVTNYTAPIYKQSTVFQGE